MKSKRNVNAVTYSEKEKQENLEKMVINGEQLATALIGTLSLFGSSPEALMAETYAMAKAWAALKAVGLSKDLDPAPLFNKLVPMHKEEMDACIGEMFNLK